jgi:flagellar basal body-associated protein FliL
MKKVISYSSPTRAYSVLVIIILILAGIIILGSIYAAVRPSYSKPLFRLGPATQQEQEPPLSGNINIFTGIGRLRIPLSGASTLILSIVFPYPADDRAFFEELTAKTENFRTIASEYFTSLSAQRGGIDEDAAKAEILRRYNLILRLGKIQALYFNDLHVL